MQPATDERGAGRGHRSALERDVSHARAHRARRCSRCRRAPASNWRSRSTSPASGAPLRVAVQREPGSRPLLSEDLALLRSLAGVFGFMLENVRLQQRRQEQDQVAQELRLQTSRSELKALRAQINPHFLFNALNAIASLIHTDPARADAAVEQLAEVFRYTLRRSEQEWAPLDQELAFARPISTSSRHASARGCRSRSTPTAARAARRCRRCCCRRWSRTPSSTASRRCAAPAASRSRARVEDDDARARGDATPARASTRRRSRSRAPSGESFGLRSVRDRLRGHFGERAALELLRDERAGSRSRAFDCRSSTDMPLVQEPPRRNRRDPRASRRRRAAGAGTAAAAARRSRRRAGRRRGRRRRSRRATAIADDASRRRVPRHRDAGRSRHRAGRVAARAAALRRVCDRLRSLRARRVRGRRHRLPAEADHARAARRHARARARAAVAAQRSRARAGRGLRGTGAAAAAHAAADRRLRLRRRRPLPARGVGGDFYRRAAARPRTLRPRARRRLRQGHAGRAGGVEPAGAARNDGAPRRRAPRPTWSRDVNRALCATIESARFATLAYVELDPRRPRGPDRQRRPPAADRRSTRERTRAAGALHRARARHASRGARSTCTRSTLARRRGARGLQRRRDRSASTRTARSSARRTWSQAIDASSRSSAPATSAAPSLRRSRAHHRGGAPGRRRRRARVAASIKRAPA